jgi:hypothetical protein
MSRGLSQQLNAYAEIHNAHSRRIVSCNPQFENSLDLYINIVVELNHERFSINIADPHLRRPMGHLAAI